MSVQGEMRESLAQLAPGTELREAVENILTAQSGALIVVGGDDEVDRIIDGGFRVDCAFSAPRLYELAKMDGAVVISANRRIRYANVHLQPDPLLPTAETGTRHRTAERVARQTGALVIAVSHRRGRVSVYRGAERFVLHDPALLLAEANQGLQTLAVHRRLLDLDLSALGALEVQGAATVLDVARALQRCGAVLRIGAEVHERCLELGVKGRLVQLQLAELLEGVEAAEQLLVRDYARAPGGRPERATELRDIAAGLRLGEDLDAFVEPRGHRLLARVPRLPTAVADHIVAHFGGIGRLLAATRDELDAVDGVGAVRARAVESHVQRLRGEAGAAAVPAAVAETSLPH